LSEKHEFKEETMLVLSRTQGQRIVIGDDIIVTVNKVDGNRVSSAASWPMPARRSPWMLRRRAALLQ
jgi:hypothetical protein